MPSPSETINLVKDYYAGNRSAFGDNIHTFAGKQTFDDLVETRSSRDTRIFFRHEFNQLPALSTQFFAYSAKSSGRVINNEWMISGANMQGFNSARGSYFDTSGDGLIWLGASSKSSNRLTLRPRPNGAVNKAYSKWASMLWGTDEEVRFDTTIKTSAAAAAATTTSGEMILAGLVLTHAFDDHSGSPTITDDDQVQFVRDNRKSATRLYVLTSIGGTDAFHDTGIDLAASTRYRLQLDIQSDRTVKAYVNRTLVATTSALTTAKNLIPHIAMRANGNLAARGRVGVYYVEMSKNAT